MQEHTATYIVVHKKFKYARKNSHEKINLWGTEKTTKLMYYKWHTRNKTL